MTDTGFKILDEPLPGIMVIHSPRFEDERGVFAKGYHLDFFAALPSPFHPAEQFTSTSAKKVLRGMHFQAGISAQQKLVSCIAGRLLDVIVDVRPESPNYNKPFSIELNGCDTIALLIGKGYAHGFLSLAESTIMQYLTTSVHCAKEDKGVLWSSIDLDWPITAPIVSPRDAEHPNIGNEPCTFL